METSSILSLAQSLYGSSDLRYLCSSLRGLAVLVGHLLGATAASFALRRPWFAVAYRNASVIRLMEVVMIGECAWSLKSAMFTTKCRFCPHLFTLMLFQRNLLMTQMIFLIQSENIQSLCRKSVYTKLQNVYEEIKNKSIWIEWFNPAVLKGYDCNLINKAC